MKNSDPVSQRQKKYLLAIRRNSILIQVSRILLFVFFVGIWEISARTGLIDSFIFSSPGQILEKMKEMLLDHTLIDHVSITLLETLISFALVTVLGIGCGVLLWAFPRLSLILEPYLVVSHPDERMRVFDPCLWMDPLGRLWFTWSQSLGYFDGMHGVWASVCDAPDAPQPTFGPPRRIANGVMMCKPIVLSDGAWLFPCAVWSKWARPEEAPETEGERFSNAVVTTDLGQTFVRRGGADVKNRCFDEHMVVERKDHSLWMLVRRYDGIGESFSYDGGYHWVGRGHSGIPGPCSRFFLRRLRSGKLLLINHVDFRGRNNLAARLSDDDGKTWSTGLLLDGRDNVSYPDGVEDENGTLYVIYDRERLKDREILLAVFREEDILRGAMEQQDLCLVERRVVSKAGVRE